MTGDYRLRTMRRMISDALSDGGEHTTRGIMDAVSAEDPRCRNRNYVYSMLSRMERSGEVVKDVRKVPGRTEGSGKTEAYWRSAVA